MPAATVTGPPDFVGVGTQRSGTTWWFRTLLEHPGIRAPRRKRKELHFFDGFGARAMDDADIERYHDLFPREAGELVGEWTPRYMGDLWTPRLLRRAAPEARLLVLLRDPIERYRSGIAHVLDRAPHRDRGLIAADAIERGRYASQLRRLHLCFEPERILVLQYERCRNEPAEQYRRTLRFLGVAEDHAPEFERRRGTTMAAQKESLWPGLRDALVVALEEEVRALRDLVPDLDVGLWPNFAHLAAE